MMNLWAQVKRGGVSCCLPFIFTLLVILGFCYSYKSSPEFKWLSEWLGLIEKQRSVSIKACIEKEACIETQSLGQGDLIELTTSAAYTTWEIIFLLYVLSCLAVMGISGYVIWNCLVGSTRAKVIASGFVLVICTIVSLLFGFARIALPKHDNDFFKVLIDAARLESIYPNVKYHLWLDPVGIGIVMLVAVATSAVLLPVAILRYSGKEDRSYFDQRSKYLRYILTAGTLMLILATLRLSALFHLVLVLLTPLGDGGAFSGASIAHESLGEIVSTVVMVMGSLYSVFLAAVYFPAAYLLNKKAGKMKVLPISEQLLRLAAIMGPFIAGSVGEILSRIG